MPNKFTRVNFTDTEGRAYWVGVFPYPSHGKRYWRLMWGQSSKVVGQRHIPGGACGNPRADGRALELARQLRQGRTIKDAIALINTWSR